MERNSRCGWGKQREEISQGNLRSLFNSGDYPAQALLNGKSGAVKVALLVSESGKVADCAIIERAVKLLSTSIVRSFEEGGKVHDRGRPGWQTCEDGVDTADWLGYYRISYLEMRGQLYT